MIKVVNNRKSGSLFHYAHFICDCLFPEIINNIYHYEEVFRKKNIHQTICNFDKIYTEVMTTKNNELLQEDFDKLNVVTVIYKIKEDYLDKLYFDKFRNFIFQRYEINFLEYNQNYPEIILVKRDGRINLIDDEYFKNININTTTGKERREIHEIDKVEEYLKNKYDNKFIPLKNSIRTCGLNSLRGLPNEDESVGADSNLRRSKSIFFEHMPFKEQVKYFNNAKLIICAHGAVMSNMFFCKENTMIIEITCNMNWEFFNNMSNILNLKHIKCIKNEYNEIIKCIESNSLVV